MRGSRGSGRERYLREDGQHADQRRISAVGPCGSVAASRRAASRRWAVAAAPAVLMSHVRGDKLVGREQDVRHGHLTQINNG